MNYFVWFMAKGLWLVTTTVTNPAFAEYVEAFQPWVESVGGSVFAKDMDSKKPAAPWGWIQKKPRRRGLFGIHVT